MLISGGIFTDNIQKFSLWFEESKNDFEMAQILFSSKKYNGAVFYYVQSAEKAIKALLFYCNLTPWGHSILNLLEEYENLNYEVDLSLKKIAQDLSRNYITSRYPDFSIKIAPKDVYNIESTQDIQNKAKLIIDFVNNEMEAKKE